MLILALLLIDLAQRPAARLILHERPQLLGQPLLELVQDPLCFFARVHEGAAVADPAPFGDGGAGGGTGGEKVVVVVVGLVPLLG